MRTGTFRSETYGNNSATIERRLPAWAKVDRTLNHLSIYNMDIFENIMSWNMHNLDGEAIDYYGTKILYRDLRPMRDAYAKGLMELGIKEGDVITLCMPVCAENLLLSFAINKLGAVSNNVNFIFLKSNFRYYTADKHSHIIICCDAYLPKFVNYLEDSSVDTVILMNMEDMLPESKKGLFKDTAHMPPKLAETFDADAIRDCLMNLGKIKGIRFERLTDIYARGESSSLVLPDGPVNMDRDTDYFYTSGTTGLPKCVVYKEYSANAYLEMHGGLDTKDMIGQRCLNIIPMTHMTGHRVCALNPMARGGCLVLQPIYDKNTFAKELAEQKISYVVATTAFYMAGVRQGVMGKDALKALCRPASGGEPVTKAACKSINDWLNANGCYVRYSIGGGATEDGGATLVTYTMPDDRTNETGKPLEPYVRIKLLDRAGNPVKQGEYGLMHVTSPAAADRYLDNEVSTAERWYVDEDGIRWGATGDIAVQHQDGSYNLLGRASDSYIDKDGKVHYLFDIEYSLDPEDPVLEWEISAFEIENGEHMVSGQIVLKPAAAVDKKKLIPYFCNKYGLDVIKYYDEFGTGQTTGKRDYLALTHDYKDYWKPCDGAFMFKVNFSGNGTHSEEKIPLTAIEL